MPTRPRGDQPVVCGMWKHVSFSVFLSPAAYFRALPFAGLPRHAIIRELLSGSSDARASYAGIWVTTFN
jgi:hypothetical protein